MQKLEQFFTSRKNLAICAIVAVVLVVGGFGGVYAYGVHLDKVAAQQEAERLTARQAEIDNDLSVAGEAVAALYSDTTLELLTDAVTQQEIILAAELVDTVAVYAATDADMTQEQKDTYAALSDELESARAMYEVATLYNSLYVEDDTSQDTTIYLALPSEELTETLGELEERLSTLQSAKPLFYSTYSGYLVTVREQLADMQAAIDHVATLFDEDGEISETVTEEQLTEAIAKLEGLKNPVLKKELLEQVQEVSEWYKAQQEEVKAASERAGSNAASGKTGISNNGSGAIADTSNASNNTPAASDGGSLAPAVEAPKIETPILEPAPAPEPPAAEEPYIISGWIGSEGLFDDEGVARQHGYNMFDTLSEDGKSFIYSGFVEITVVYSDGTVKYSIDMY